GFTPVTVTEFSSATGETVVDGTSAVVVSMVKWAPPEAPTPISPVNRRLKPVIRPAGVPGVSAAANASGVCATPLRYQVTAAAVAPAGQVGACMNPANLTSALKNPLLSVMTSDESGPFESLRPLTCPVAVPPAGMSRGEIVFAAFT